MINLIHILSGYLAKSFNIYTRLANDSDNKKIMNEQLNRILSEKSLSRATYEIVSNILKKLINEIIIYFTFLIDI